MAKKGHEGLTDVQQYSFDALTVSHPLEKLGISPGVIHILQQDSHWAKIQSDRAAIVDIHHEVVPIVDPISLVPKRVATDLILEHEKTFGGLAVLLPDIHVEEDVRQLLIQYSSRVMHGGVLLILEKRNTMNDNEDRLGILRHAGFVHTSISLKDDYILWHALSPKESHRTSVNIWEAEKAGPLAKASLAQVLKMYEDAGFLEVVDTHVIVDKLFTSHYIPHDLDMLRDGLGIRARSPCGCIVEQSLKGEWVFVGQYVCDGAHLGLQGAIKKFESLTETHTDNHEYQPFIPTIPMQKDIPPHEKIIRNHGDCGGSITEVSVELRQVRRHGNSYFRYRIDTVCTSCGDVFPDSTRMVDVAA